MDETPARRRLTIDVISDVVCPWCFVGKRRLELALARVASARPDIGAVVNWHPFELNPDLPREGVPRRAYMDAKFGAAARTAQAHARLTAIGATMGIDFRFDAIVRQPNTRDAHRLISWAQAHADAGPLVERLFCAFFHEGVDVGARGELIRLAAETGCDAAGAAAILDSSALADRVESTERRGREIGVTGVPFFIFNERVAIPGAHEPSALVEAIEQSLEPVASRST